MEKLFISLWITDKPRWPLSAGLPTAGHSLASACRYCNNSKTQTMCRKHASIGRTAYHTRVRTRVPAFQYRYVVLLWNSTSPSRINTTAMFWKMMSCVCFTHVVDWKKPQRNTAYVSQLKTRTQQSLIVFSDGGVVFIGRSLLGHQKIVLKQAG